MFLKYVFRISRFLMIINVKYIRVLYLFYSNLILINVQILKKELRFQNTFLLKL